MDVEETMEGAAGVGLRGDRAGPVLLAEAKSGLVRGL